MGRSSERRSSKASHHPNLAMFRFVALFALVAVAFAEPEADPQLFYNHWGVPAVPVVKPVVPVVKYVDPHHTEGMTKEGVPEKTDSVKIAEKQHEYAQAVEKVKNVHYVAPYTTYAGFPYVHHPVAAHVVAKREADSEADPAVFYSAYGTGYPYVASTYAHYPYTTAVAGSPYNKVVAGVPAVTTTGYTYPVVHSLGKREAEADSDAALYYRTYGYNYGSPYTYSYGTPYTYGAYPYRNVYGWY